ncbi:uncharacterized protein THITE_2153799 [Thermothielavioides terrestris NRRL 8126]|uniref:GAT domain-containing protein n=1 Tax=Thermothielavioides terrestris (strain ATCC 38088 / NRRL 8126) TaxID=578455 RepID=G2R2C0_THETT|nr:uncharacterized protein THITE_2153799 [Thermothielavioides terrestris NRRL 8126]AEO64988.1 hypothetical protein THITE_2153799 [Thermothielavioides terrestris NRRL 8126]
MAGFSMNKVLGTIRKRPTFGGSGDDSPADLANEPPEVVAAHCVGDDVIFLPAIVEAAVASPAAAAECARLTRKFMTRDHWSKPSCQYNAIMLVRILADNPGPGFTRFLDKKFVDTTKELLRGGRDPSVRQILMESLDAFETTKSGDEGLALIIEMWKKEKEKAYKAYGGGVPMAAVAGMPNPYQPRQPWPQTYYPRHHRSSKRLPDPVELANRLEEARTSAKLLEQVVASTPPSEVLSNDLIKEFAERCTSASRSIQGYMAAEDPAPDNDTMESLIDTNEQLQHALNHHHRAVLQAKKHLGIGDSRTNVSNPAPPSQQQQPQQREQQQLQSRPLPSAPGRKPIAGSSSNGKGKANLGVYDSAAVAGPSRSASATPRHETATDDDDDGQDPFRDPVPEPSGSHSMSRPTGRLGDSPPRLSFEPYHPGFGGSSSSAAAAAAAAAGGKGRRESGSDDDDDDVHDVYGATPKKEGHVFRY